MLNYCPLLIFLWFVPFPWLLCWSGYFVSYSINCFISFFSNFGLLYQNLEFSMRCFSLLRGQMRFETWPAFIDICHLNIEIQNRQSVELFWVNFYFILFPKSNKYMSCLLWAENKKRRLELLMQCFCDVAVWQTEHFHFHPHFLTNWNLSQLNTLV